MSFSVWEAGSDARHAIFWTVVGLLEISRRAANAHLPIDGILTAWIAAPIGSFTGPIIQAVVVRNAGILHLPWW